VEQEQQEHAVAEVAVLPVAPRLKETVVLA
jgi:hypothetical protein